jgi:hypothetical protein
MPGMSKNCVKKVGDFYRAVPPPKKIEKDFKTLDFGPNPYKYDYDPIF